MHAHAHTLLRFRMGQLISSRSSDLYEAGWFEI